MNDVGKSADRMRDAQQAVEDQREQSASRNMQAAMQERAIRGALGLGGTIGGLGPQPPAPVMCSRAREYLTQLARVYRNRAQRIEQLLAALPAELPHEADVELWELVTEGSRR